MRVGLAPKAALTYPIGRDGVTNREQSMRVVVLIFDPSLSPYRA